MGWKEQLSEITGPDESARKESKQRWDGVAKPLGSLGLLEDAVIKIAALTGDPEYSIENRTLLVFCADNGVVAQGITQTGSEVTAAVARGFAREGSCACTMARKADCRVVAVDMGIRDFPETIGVLNKRVGNGTADITTGPAMSADQLIQAIGTGVELAAAEKAAGTRLLVTGEMGIGNTTTASAVVSVLLGCEPEEVTGKGAGLTDRGLQKKIEVIKKAIAVNCPDPTEPLDVMSKLGGFDIAGMTGVFLGGAIHGIPVLIDGVISAAAALCAAKLCPAACKAMIATHLSAEPAGKMILDALRLRPMITAGLRLGEGTGALCAIPMLDMAYALYQGSTFDDLKIESYKEL